MHINAASINHNHMKYVILTIIFEIIYETTKYIKKMLIFE